MADKIGGKTVLLFEADASQLQQTKEQVKQGLKEVGQAGQEAGKAASAGLKQVDSAADSTAQAVKATGAASRETAKDVQQVGASAAAAGKSLRDTTGATDGLTAAQRRLVQAAERSAIQAEEGTAGWLRYRAAQQGVSDVVAPYVARMDAARAGTAGLGVSVAQTNAAMRQLPAQFSDIVVSLQGGQAPLTVLLQQGSQIKDSFGGAGNAAKALGGYIGGMISPLTVGAAALAALGVAAASGYLETSRLNEALIVTGNITGKSTIEISAIAERVGEMTGAYSAARSAVAALVETGTFGAQQLEVATLGVTNLVKLTGVEVGKAASVFESLQKDPTRAVVELNQKYNFLTLAVYEQIKALEEQGQKQEAARVATNLFATTIAQRRAEVVQNLGYIEQSWAGIKLVIDAATNAAKDFGRPGGPEEERAEKMNDLQSERLRLLKEIDDTQKVVDRGNLIPKPRLDQLKRDLAGIEDQLRSVNGQISKASTDNAARAAEQERQNQQIGQSKVLDSYLESTSRMTKGQQLTAAIENAEKEFQKAVVGLDQNTEKYKLAVQRRDTEIANARERLAAKPVRAPKISVDGNAGQLAGLDAEIAGYATLLDSLRTTGDATVALNKHEAEAAKIGEQLTGTMNGKTRAFLEEKKAREEAAGALLRQVDREKESIKLTSAFRQERDRYLGTLDGNVTKIHESAQAVEDEVAAFGLSRTALAELTIARLENRREMLAGFSGSEEEIERINQEIAARRRLATALDEKEVKEASKKAAEDVDRDWNRITDQIGQSLSDQIAGGGRSGRDVLKGLFNNLVLRPVLEPFIKGGVNAIAGALSGKADGSGSSWTDMASNASSLYDSFTGKSLIGKGLSGVSNYYGGAAASNSVIGSAAASEIGGLVGGGAAVGGAAASAYAAGATAAGAYTVSGATAGAIGGLVGGGGGVAAGGTLAGAMSTIGAAMPYIGAAIAIYTLLSGSFKGEKRSGGTFGWADGQSQFLHGPSGGTDGKDGIVNAAISATASGVNDLLKSVGSSLSVNNLIAGFEGSEKGRGGVMSGVTLSNGVKLGEDGSGSNYKGTYYNKNLPTTLTTEAAAGLLVTDLKQLQIEVLQQADDIPAALRKLVEGVSAPALTDEAATALLATVTTQVSGVKTLRMALDALPFGAVVTSTYDAVAAFIEYSGGLDAATSNLQSYLQNYTSQEEKLAAQRKQITDALGAVGVALPNSKAAFRAMVESLDDTTDAGARAKAAMLGVNQAFSDWITTSDEVADAAREKAKNDADIALQPARDAIAALTTSFVDAAATAQTRVDTALQTVRDTYNTDKSALSNTISRLTSVIKGLDGTLAGLRVGDLSPDSLQQQYQTARSELDDLIAKALSGDEDAHARWGAPPRPSCGCRNSSSGRPQRMRPISPSTAATWPGCDRRRRLKWMWRSKDCNA